MRGNNGGEHIWVTDAGDDVMVSFDDAGEEGTIYLTPKKVRKLIGKLEATLEVRDGDETILDRHGDAWKRVANGNYAVEALVGDGRTPFGVEFGYLKATWGPLRRA